MGEIWIKEAERLGGGSIGGAMDSPGAPGRVVWHTTESGHGDASFTNVGKYLTSVASEPHILYDPTTDRLGQYGPLNQSARALKNDGVTRTNRTGKVCIQVEVLARAATPFTGYWKPGPNFKALMRAIRSWGVPDSWPAGGCAPGAPRNRTTWATKGGHYGHCHVPGNDHWDPGAIDTSAILKAAPGTGTVSGGSSSPSVSRATVTINGLKYGYGATGAHVTAVGKALVTQGCSAYVEGPGPTWTDADTKSYQKWQIKCGYSGSDADGVPGETSLKKLMGTLPGLAGSGPATKPASTVAVPTVDLSNLIAAARRDPGLKQGGTTHPADVKVVEAALKAEGLLSATYAADGSFGSTTVTAYAAWQRKCGYTGSAADGIPGKASLEKLGAKRGFKVKA
ncbi:MULTISPECIES: peptidoglycan-binding protein [unclassified Streptomyces]|uniref:peptidoglycan-binding protein n=1 Tax=unclassified Streptomyces TaxID=2593676 RepID=UPI00036AACF8|nr:MULTISPECIES: peptidoglycan-binding protein [unclassified Streptomyces]MYY03068.1 peptidoglycan-binding protein LysM [Streptomyces sp. SID4913]